MADIADDGSDRADFFLELAKNKQKENADAERNKLPAIGKCYNCHEKLHGELRWCDKDCLADWQFREKRKHD